MVQRSRILVEEGGTKALGESKTSDEEVDPISVLVNLYCPFCLRCPVHLTVLKLVPTRIK